MTFTQLEYVIAVDRYKHFAKAAKACFITQPTLSMQLHKLEKEIGTKIFDRSKQPVITTEAGIDIIAHAKKIIGERDLLLDILQVKKGILAGNLKIGIIPTLAPYLLPLCIPSFTNRYPDISLTVIELTTENIILGLKSGNIDAGILATPLNEPGIKEEVIFYEEMIAYISPKNAAYKKSYLLPQDIDPDKLWLLEEGHCFRSQIANLCQLRKASMEGSNFEYEAGSLETLKKFVEKNDGITILPDLATLDLTGKQKKLLRRFKNPAPVREISVVVHRNHLKRRLIDLFKKEIIKSLPEKVFTKKNRYIISI